MTGAQRLGIMFKASNIEDQADTDNTLSEIPDTTGLNQQVVDRPRGIDEAEFASISLLSPFIPWADPKHPQAKSFDKWYARLDVVLVQACIVAFLVLILNVVGTILLNARYKNFDIFHGNCKTASTISLVLHAAINVLSTLLLGASNLCMQLAAAPTRNELDRAHEKSRFLDIGIPSYRNLKFIAPQRRVLWWVLAVSSTPLHFL
jgi:hypothetical protein